MPPKPAARGGKAVASAGTTNKQATPTAKKQATSTAKPPAKPAAAKKSADPKPATSKGTAVKTTTAKPAATTKAAPAKAAPAKAAPGKSAPAKAAPGKSAPAKAAPEKAAPGKSAPAKAAPAKAATGKAATSKSATGKAATAKAAPKTAPAKPPTAASSKNTSVVSTPTGNKGPPKAGAKVNGPIAGKKATSKATPKATLKQTPKSTPKTSPKSGIKTKKDVTAEEPVETDEAKISVDQTAGSLESRTINENEPSDEVMDRQPSQSDQTIDDASKQTDTQKTTEPDDGMTDLSDSVEKTVDEMMKAILDKTEAQAHNDKQNSNHVWKLGDSLTKQGPHNYGTCESGHAYSTAVEFWDAQKRKVQLLNKVAEANDKHTQDMEEHQQQIRREHSLDHLIRFQELQRKLLVPDWYKPVGGTLNKTYYKSSIQLGASFS